MITILTGNVLDTLPTLPSNSVQCCVTSPPYWGLRDYGTGTWEGGDAGCDHVQRMARGDAGRVSTDDRPGNINPAPVNTPIQYRDTCGKCGARRIDQQLGSEATPDCGRPFMTLRKDLTEKQYQLVVSRLEELGLI